MDKVLWILGIIVALAGGIAAGFVFGGKKMKKEIEDKIGKTEEAVKKLVDEATVKAEAVKKEKLLEAKSVVAVAREYGVSAPETVAAARENGFSSYYEANAVKNRVSAPPTRSMELRVMKLGDLGFVFAPYEMFSTQGMYIKQNAQCDMTFIVTNSEGDMGYMPSRKGIEIGSYEACVTDFAPGTAETLAEEFVKLLDAVK